MGATITVGTDKPGKARKPKAAVTAKQRAAAKTKLKNAKVAKRPAKAKIESGATPAVTVEVREPQP